MKFKISKVLLLHKITTYEHYSLNKSGRSSKLFGKKRDIRRFKMTHDAHVGTLKSVENLLKKHNVPYKKAARGQKINYSPYSLVITVGGDGTFLEAARNAKSQLLLGVNSDSVWSVGKLCAANQRNFEKIFLQVLSGHCRYVQVNRMQLKINDRVVDAAILNDALICHRNPAAMSIYELKLGKFVEEQRSSGVWVSTAAGSSSAIYSAGGKLLPLNSKRLQYLPRELYVVRKRRYKLRGGVLRENDKIVIASLMKEGVVYIDGSHVHFPLKFGDTAVFSKSPYPLYMVIT